MNETTKSRLIWGDLENRVLIGKGIDIGCGGDPVKSDAKGFDVQDGDANRISDYVKEQFDYVYSSHCLEHMHHPDVAIREWWKLVKVGGYLFFCVPDEDIYEQGVFPSRFNPDHKATFTISKRKSWSPVSHNVLKMVTALPGARLIRLELQDIGCDRSRLRHGEIKPPLLMRILFKINGVLQKVGLKIPGSGHLSDLYFPTDQTLCENVLCQIQCIIQKEVE